LCAALKTTNKQQIEIKTMSGGAYNYGYAKIEQLADEMNPRMQTPERRAFLRLLERVAKAAKAIEWNDSGDGDPDEARLIQEALGKDYEKMCMDELVNDAAELCKTMRAYMHNHKLSC
jgi:hypothetical protein